MKILIVGGTGALGSEAAKLLVAKDWDVRVMTRQPQSEKAKALQALGVEVVPGDLRDATSLTHACLGMDAVLAAAHSIFGRGSEASKYVDLAGHIALIDIAQRAGVKHFVYTSAYDAAADHPSLFFRIKDEVSRYLQRSGLSYTILQPTAFMESHAHMMIGQPILEKGKVTLFGKGENPRNFVAAADVARFVLIAFEDGRAAGDTIVVGGPEEWTNMQVVDMYARLAGRQAQVSHIPLGVLRVMSAVLRPFHPGLSQVMQTSIWHDITDQSCDMRHTLSKYPIEMTWLEDWVQDHLPDGSVRELGLA